ncbi:hypothetical protein [Streptomyces sp. H51]|uniref:hypothetical protein n=1 Tax=Streptomyces sp. H51 TaxID=3111770 RepID=UPI002D7965E6|nr:hypothetical protein [Streptomyces sp. H51]
MTAARPGKERPTADQVRNLIGRAERRQLTPEEAMRLRAGVEHLIASQADLALQDGQPTSAPHSLRLACAALPAADRNSP